MNYQLKNLNIETKNGKIVSVSNDLSKTQTYKKTFIESLIGKKVLAISKGSGKMDGVDSINGNSLTNKFCQTMKKTETICKSCYSNKFLSYRKNVKERFTLNDLFISNFILDKTDIPIINSKYFRLNSFGEIINQNHLINFINICNDNPQTNFSLWTKRLDIVTDVFLSIEKPKNLKIISSNSKINNIVTETPVHCDKVFNVVSINQDNINCKGACLSCLKCYDSKYDNVKVIIEKLK